MLVCIMGCSLPAVIHTGLLAVFSRRVLTVALLSAAAGSCQQQRVALHTLWPSDASCQP